MRLMFSLCLLLFLTSEALAVTAVECAAALVVQPEEGEYGYRQPKKASAAECVASDDVTAREIGRIGHDAILWVERADADLGTVVELYRLRQDKDGWQRIWGVAGGAACHGGVRTARVEGAAVLVERRMNMASLMGLLLGEAAYGLDGLDDGSNRCMADVREKIAAETGVPTVQKIVLAEELPMRDGHAADSCIGAALRDVAGDDRILEAKAMAVVADRIEKTCLPLLTVRLAGRYERLETASLILSPKEGEDGYDFSIFALDSPLKPTPHTGEIGGALRPEQNKALFVEGQCGLSFVFDHGGVTIAQDGSDSDCGAGAGVSYAGYLRGLNKRHSLPNLPSGQDTRQ